MGGSLQISVSLDGKAGSAPVGGEGLLGITAQFIVASDHATDRISLLLPDCFPCLRASPVVEIAPGASSAVVFANISGDDWLDAEEATAALTEVGYEAGGGEGGIPRAGVLDALLEVWRQTV